MASRRSRIDDSSSQASNTSLLCSCADCVSFRAWSDGWQQNDMPPPSSSLEVPIECQAITLFMNDYQGEGILPSDPRLMTKPILFTRQVYVSALSCEAVHPATAAPAIGVFAKFIGRPELKVWSMRKYGEAIQMIQQALQDPDSALTEGTLQGILVLKLFEVSQFCSCVGE